MAEASSAKAKSDSPDDQHEKQSIMEGKERKVGQQRRQSKVRDRRSSRGGLLFANLDDLCSVIPADIPDENRLQILLQQSFTLSTRTAFNEVLEDAGEASQLASSVEKSFADVSDEMFSLDKLKVCVAPVNRSVENQTGVSYDMKESARATVTYIEKLEKESRDWDKLKEEAEAKAKARKVSKKMDDPQAEAASEPLKYCERLRRKLDAVDERLLTRMTTIERITNSYNRLAERAEAEMNAATLKLQAETAGTTDVKNVLEDMM